MRRALLSLMALAALAAPALAQQQPAGHVTNWPTSCQSVSRQHPLVCVTSTVAYLRDSGQKMAEIRIVTTPGRADTIEIIGPFGVSFDSPFRLKADNAEIASGNIRTCEQDGCHVFIEVTEAMRDALMAAQALTVIFSTPEQSAVEIPLPAAGLADAYKAIGR